MMKNNEKRILNLWELKPQRLAKWESTPEGNVVVLVPKFRNPLFAKWLMPRLKKPNFRINLDEVGSSIWRLCDGATSVSSIAAALKEQFGGRVEPVEDRIHRFLNQLERGDLISTGNTGVNKSEITT
ncbi:MAG: PqqD family protein [Ignavibacteriales bacterium]|nr:PqqD family protein [Ignavibacteriales bacterium]